VTAPVPQISGWPLVFGNGRLAWSRAGRNIGRVVALEREERRECLVCNFGIGIERDRIFGME
jgi:hypothetical protein